ncbi:MAG: FAD:protein FMN transferase [Solirubrobacterales bacterium]|nr:FAD:protein FMN transferase [Solirubrobacterales bacterium]
MTAEAVERFGCFGDECVVLVAGGGPAGQATDAAARARRRMGACHEQFSRFDPTSELSRLNRNPHRTVAVTPAMARFVEVALAAAEATNGLVDPTLVRGLERAGYDRHLISNSLPLERALSLAPPRAPARPRQRADWTSIEVDRRAGAVTRPPGVALDSGGIAKGLVGDILATLLEGHAAFAIEAAGDVRFGGAATWRRPVHVTSPFDGALLHVFDLVRGAAATSSIGRRAWLDPEGRPAHHLLDPATGRPAFTGVVQATALAPTGIEAETRSKAALLVGPDAAAGWLPHGGLLVLDDGRVSMIDPATSLNGVPSTTAIAA